MQLSDPGERFLKREEGVVATVYLDQEDLPSIGVGHLVCQRSELPPMPPGKPTDKKDPAYKEKLAAWNLLAAPVRAARLAIGRKKFPRALTPEEISTLLRTDLARFEAAVNGIRQDFEQYEYDALVSFAFNIGVGSLKDGSGFLGSTLARILRGATKSEDYDLAALEFPKWTNRGLPVLVGRRAREKKLFETGDYGKI